ncbi:cilia- and flagella-associated protein 144-like [Colius striatus]|uniref:cilia- and flagella-associated protein 144 n=1 Tax=Colius striatus TaxID=57412 RepID=UPI002B1DDEF8|nr:cilia- and flagella-associated protein 144 [Colius striatus]XP_061859932.1 cilia- and flagella-associated protein 144-like [Colius striatus]
MAARSGEKEPLDAVRLDRLLCERVRKELQCQTLHTRFDVNPLRRVHTIARKPMSWHDAVEEPADDKFLNLIHHAALEPTKKYSEPQTESQEVGWNTTPLVPVDRTDRRLHFPHRRTEITK